MPPWERGNTPPDFTEAQLASCFDKTLLMMATEKGRRIRASVGVVPFQFPHTIVLLTVDDTVRENG